MASDESPTPNTELTEEEAAQLKELKAKERAAQAAAAAEEAERAKQEEEERQENYRARPLSHVLVRHMGRSPRTRTMRAARSGHRRQGVLLDDGTRIRKKGKRRFTEVDLRELINNHQKFLEHVRVGSIEVCDPRNEEPIPYDDLVSGIKNLGVEMAAKEATLAKEKYEEDLKAWKEACKGLKKDAPRPPKPSKPEGVDFQLDETGIEEDSVDGSEKPENVAPPPPETLTEETQTEETQTEEDSIEGETSEGEAENGYTHEQLMKKTRSELDKVAAEEYEVEDPESLPNKEAVIDAIFAASETGEE
jgi:hypothetical protein